MLRFKHLILAAAFAAFVSQSFAKDGIYSQKIYINEVMPSMIGGELDRLMEYPDGWVELYNPTTQSQSLYGWRIGKESKFKKCYELPNITIPEKGHVIIYCDREDSVVVENGNVVEIHTDFRIRTDSIGFLFLYDNHKNPIDSICIPKLFRANVAWGRLTDGSDSLGYELNVTKAAANEGGHGIAILPSPVITPSDYITSDPKGGMNIIVKHVGSKTNKMSNGEKVPNEAECHYTLDGSEPTLESPVLARNSSAKPAVLQVKQNTILKTRYFLDGYIPSPSEAHVFLFHGRPFGTLPVVSLTVNDDDLNSEEYGILENQPKNEDEVHDPAYKHDWRRPATLTYFRASASASESELKQKCEIRVGGAYTRMNDQKSIIVYADNRFGTKDYFEKRFWSSTRGSVDKVPSLALRAAGNDYGGSFMRDAIAQMMMGMYTDVDWQAYQPAIYYINDTYKGIVNIRERANEDNVWSHYGLDDITLVEISSSSPMGELKKGDYGQYLDFFDFTSHSGHSLEEYAERMDVEEYTNMMIDHIFFGNTDFPANNMVLWKPNTEDGRWRWIIKDVDRAFNIWNSCPAGGEYLKWILREENNITFDTVHNSEVNTRMFRVLIDSVPGYSDYFVDHLSVYMNDFLKPSNINYWIEWAKKQVEPEQPYAKGFTQNWKNELENMKKWGADRVVQMQKQLQERFGLGELIPVRVNNAVRRQDIQNMTFFVNGVRLTNLYLDGELYRGREYTFTGSEKSEKYDVLGWTLTETKGEEDYVTTCWDKVLVYTPTDDVTSFTVNVIRGVNGVEEHSDSFQEPVQTLYYNMTGVCAGTPFKGLNVVKYIYEDGSFSTEKLMF